MKKPNIKTPIVFRVGVIILCALLFSWRLVGDFYARYSTSVTTSNGARVAKIDCAVNYEFSGYGNLGDINGDGGLVYAVIEEFSVENTGEVSYLYDLKLKFSKDVASATYDAPVAPPNGITLYAPKDVSNVTYVYHPSQDSTTGATVSKSASELTGGAFTAFIANTVYYAYSSDGTSYSWATATLENGALIVPSEPLSIGKKYYYKIMYFIAPIPGLNLAQQQMTLFYNITCSQID